MQSREQGLLRDVIGVGPFGNSDAGHSFVLKRLNPADDSIYPTGVPDASSELSYVQNFKNQRILSYSDIADATGGTWNADIVLFAHPLISYALHLWDASGEHHRLTLQLNSQLSTNVPGNPEDWTMNEFYAAMKGFRDQCEKYRVLYCGLTGNMVASDMYNAGACTASQYVWEPENFTSFNKYPQVADEERTVLKTPVLAFPDKLKSYTQLCQMPNAYTNDAKYGFYMPLKIFDNTYRKTNDLVTYVYSQEFEPRYYAQFDTTARTPTIDVTIPASLAPWEAWFPIGGVNGVYLANQLNLQFASYYMGQISLRNLSDQAQFYLTWRSGYQMVCTPGSMFTQYITPPLPYDVESIVSYSQMVNYLQDCYPDTYNDWGLLKQKLKEAWARIRPYVGIAGKAVMGALAPRLSSALSNLF